MAVQGIIGDAAHATSASMVSYRQAMQRVAHSVNGAIEHLSRDTPPLEAAAGAVDGAFRVLQDVMADAAADPDAVKSARKMAALVLQSKRDIAVLASGGGDVSAVVDNVTQIRAAARSEDWFVGRWGTTRAALDRELNTAWAGARQVDGLEEAAVELTPARLLERALQSLSGDESRAGALARERLADISNELRRSSLASNSPAGRRRAFWRDQRGIGKVLPFGITPYFVTIPIGAISDHGMPSFAIGSAAAAAVIVGAGVREARVLSAVRSDEQMILRRIAELAVLAGDADLSPTARGDLVSVVQQLAPELADDARAADWLPETVSRTTPTPDVVDAAVAGLRRISENRPHSVELSTRLERELEADMAAFNALSREVDARAAAFVEARRDIDGVTDFA